MKIVILGGGSAGWMAGTLMAKRWMGRAEVTVIESSDIGIIGVGEGSTPHLKGLFRKLGLDEDEWMPHCKATFKNGIRFNGWSERPGFKSYFHPFRTGLDSFTTPTFYANTRKRRQGHAVPAHPDRFSLLTHLAENRLAPRAPENFPFRMMYGYHFDAALLSELLRDIAVSKLGVTHLDRKINHVSIDETGKITDLIADGGDKIAGDLFVDCSGFRSVIAQQALGAKFISFEKNLFNDAAVVMPTEAAPDGTDSQTISTALTNGWVFRIPLRHRFGNGYVYSSKYRSADEAEAELRAHLGVSDDVKARHLNLKVGKLETAWTSNCLAVGLSQSFIEPLEATSLFIIQRGIEDFIEAFEAGGFTPERRDSYNQTTGGLCEGIRDYIVAHYKVNGRRDTAYWRDNAANVNISDSLRGILRSWQRGEDIRKEIAFQSIGKYWGDLPWHCLLAGYGCFPREDKLKPVPPRLANASSVDDFIRRCGLNFSDHRQVLAGQEREGAEPLVGAEAHMFAA